MKKKRVLMYHLVLLFILLFFSACFSPEPDSPLKNTYWKLIELHHEEITKISRQNEAHLVFHVNQNSVHGSDGCNQIHADYILNDNSFSFGHLAATRMSCDDELGQAMKFHHAIQQTDRILIQGDSLFLFSADTILAKFQAFDEY